MSIRTPEELGRGGRALEHGIVGGASHPFPFDSMVGPIDRHSIIHTPRMYVHGSDDVPVFDSARLLLFTPRSLG
jgi:hypothetical protein